jgi:HlyD family secretion protein
MDIPVKAPRPRRHLQFFAACACAFGLIAWLSSTRSSEHSVDRREIQIDTVRKGTVRREIAAQGTLVPESVVVVVATTSARVERVLVRAGDSVVAGAPLIELGNPDLTIRSLEAEQRMRQAETELAATEASLQAGVLTQRSQLATVQTQHRTAVIDAQLADSLLQKALSSPGEVAARRAVLSELNVKLESERSRLALLDRTMHAQLSARRRQAEQLARIADAEAARAAAMTVRAPRSGVVQDLVLDPGQWVPAGQVLGKIVDPRRLKANVRVPETLARDVVVGQRARVDTRNALIDGVVIRKAPSAQGGTIQVEIRLGEPLPPGAVPDLGVAATITVETWNDVLHVRRPASLLQTGVVTLFIVSSGGSEAVATQARLADASDEFVRVVGGVGSGAAVITSETASFGLHRRIRLR